MVSLSEKQKAYRSTEEYKENHREWEKDYRRRFPEKALLRSCRKRARREGREFELEESDIIIPAICPILETPIVYASEIRGEWPSVDRVDNSKGYIKGNVRVISYKANRLKGDMTLKQVRNLLALMEEHFV